MGERRSRPGTGTDRNAVRRRNLAAVVRALTDHPRTRARLATDLGLTKATVSSLVSELGERGLARTHEPDRDGTIGRPGHRVELTPARVLGVGLEVNVDHLAVAVLDLAGNGIIRQRESLDVSKLAPTDALAAGVRLATAAVEKAAIDKARVDMAAVDNAAGGNESIVAGVGVAIPGLIDRGTGVARVVPNLNWPQTPVRDVVTDLLPWPRTPVLVDNETNLATVGEFTEGTPEDTDLLYITGGVGVGGGVIAGGRLLRGVAGFAGEVGHITIDPNGPPCGCGRRGCWETCCGFTALLDAAADRTDTVHDPSRDLDERIELLLTRARRGDERTLAAFDRVGHALGFGAAMLVNVLNPGVLVLGGYFASLGDYLADPVRHELAARVIAPELGGCRVELSRLGLAAPATGAAHAVLQPVREDPTLVPGIRAVRFDNLEVAHS